MASGTLVGTTLAGYRLDALLGRGGMGEVYRASDPELAREVALKLISPEHGADPVFRERFAGEVAAQAALEHTHVCPVYRAGEAEDGTVYVAMRLLSGGSLADAIAGAGPLEPDRAVTVLTHLASALDAAHARGLVHADVKPANVLLDEAGNVYLCDFGLAALAEQTPSVGADAPTLAGTLSYLAPECLQGSPASAASDQYALACLGHFLLAGEPPFVREHEAALAYAHLREEPPSLAERGLRRLDGVLLTGLAKDPTARPTSCAAFANAVAEALARPEPVEKWPAELPRPATRLVGRLSELSELGKLLEVPDTRLVTLTGPGGTGKTRLALQAAAEAAGSFPEGARWVSLAPLAEPAHALSAIAEALDVPEQPGEDLRASLRQALVGRRVLLCLDNCEHLLPAFARDVAALRDIEAGPLLLCTSRERLDLQSERLYPVPALEEDEGVELFRERAAYANPRFDPEDAAIPALCERLDSLPLALELAAARSDVYGPAELLRALSERLDLLTGPRDADPRHATLAATIAWSYDLLAPAEQSAFRRLSVFAGGCFAEAALEIAGADLPLLSALVAKSLVRTRESELGRRYWMLETVRQFASAQLEAADELSSARSRHSIYFCRRAVESEDALAGEREPTTVEILTLELENLRAALAYGLSEDPALLVAAVTGIRRFVMFRPDLAHETYRLLEQALELIGEDGPLGTRASARFVAGTLAATWRFDDEGGVSQLDRAIVLLRELDDRPTLARALNNRAAVAHNHGDWPTARSYFEECIALHRDGGDERSYGESLANLGILTLGQGDLVAARPLLEEALAIRGGTVRMDGLALLEICEGNFERATELATAALELADSGRSPVASDSQWILAQCEIRTGDHEAARVLLASSFDYFADTTDDWNMDGHLLTTALLGASVDPGPLIARILGAALELGGGVTAYERWWRDEIVDALTTSLAGGDVEELVEEGRRLPRDGVIALARTALTDTVRR